MVGRHKRHNREIRGILLKARPICWSPLHTRMDVRKKKVENQSRAIPFSVLVPGEYCSSRTPRFGDLSNLSIDIAARCYIKFLKLTKIKYDCSVRSPIRSKRTKMSIGKMTIINHHTVRPSKCRSVFIRAAVVVVAKNDTFFLIRYV